MPYHIGLGVAYDLAYRTNFDASEKSNDDKLPANDKYFEWFEKYKCQTCDDEDGLDFNSSTEEHIEHQRFLIYRLPFCQIVNGKRSCPECVEDKINTEEFKASSALMTKTDAMKMFKLKKEEIETLVVARTTSGKYGTTSLYKREECKELGEKKTREKELKKQQKKQDKAGKTSAKTRKTPSQSSTKKTGDGQAAQQSTNAKKRGRKSLALEDSAEEEEEEEGKNAEEDVDDWENLGINDDSKPSETRNSRRKRQKVNYEEPVDEEDVEDSKKAEASSPPQLDVASSQTIKNDAAERSGPSPTTRGRGRPKKTQA